MRRSMVIVVGLLVVALGSGTARAGDPEVKREGPCSGNSEWKLEVRLDDGAFRVRWEARLRGSPGTVATESPSQRHPHRVHVPNHQRGDGEAQLRLRGENLAGRDTFAGSARNLGAARPARRQRASRERRLRRGSVIRLLGDEVSGGACLVVGRHGPDPRPHVKEVDHEQSCA